MNRGRRKGEKKGKEITYLLKNLLATIFTTHGVLNDRVVLTKILVETCYTVKSKTNAYEVYHFV